jgi:alanine racemase
MLHSASARKQTALSIESPPAVRETALNDGLRVWAEIDLDRLAANVSALAERAEPAKLLAVVKGNAYGHGSVPVARVAIEAGAWGLGVIGVDEGEELRRAGIEAPILVLGSSTPAMARRIVEADLRCMTASLDFAQALSDAAVEAGREARVHLKVETGLNRFGAPPEEAVVLAETMRKLPGIVVEGAGSHFASVDEGDKAFSYEQYAAFRLAADRLDWLEMQHISSTGGLLDLPDLNGGLVRCGIGIYGYYPGETQHVVPLSPVLSLRSRVARVAELQPGQSVGYGRSWMAQRPSRVALVMAGYADGIRRSLSNKGVALVRGCRVPYAGRVAMDMLMLDITEVPEVEVDDEVTLIGEQGDERVDADELGALAGTISYEILAGIMHRVPRLYVRGGSLTAVHDLSGFREVTST